MKRPALGKGLDAILGGAGTAAAAAEPATAAAAPGTPRMVELDRIWASRGQPRRRFDDGALDELASSIREKGIIQPLVVTEGKGGFELVAGERRLRAATRAGLDKVPVIIKPRVSESDLLELALIENIQREDLGPLEEAAAYQRLVDDFGLTQEEVAKRVGKSRTSVTNTLRLRSLPDPVRQLLEAGEISGGHARALLGIATASGQISLAREIVKKALSVRQTEEEVRRAADSQRSARNGTKAVPKPAPGALEQALSRSLGTRARIQRRGERGKIVIEFYSAAELNRLVERLST